MKVINHVKKILLAETNGSKYIHILHKKSLRKILYLYFFPYKYIKYM